MNSESSRSHLICVLLVTLTNRNNGLTTVGKLTLVDLAGSEVSYFFLFDNFPLFLFLYIFILYISELVNLV